MVILASADDVALKQTAAGPICAVALMASGMLTAAVTGRFWAGITFAVLSGLLLAALSFIFGTHSLAASLLFWLTVCVASISFAARGTLFARSALEKGWWIAAAVVAGEAAILITATAQPGALPDWLMALLPAQWASYAFSAVSLDLGFSNPLIVAALFALGGTAGATLLVAKLWPKRWPYLIMFSTWIGLSALVYHQLDALDTEQEPPALRQ